MTQTKYYKNALKNKTDKILPLILRLDRIALKVSFAVILVTTILVLFYGPITEELYGTIISAIIWYFVMFSFWTLSVTLPLLIIINAYRNFTRRPAWTFVKRETILFFKTSILFVLLCVIGQIRN